MRISMAKPMKPLDPKVAAQIKKGRKFMKQYRDTFRALAKAPASPERR